MALVFLGLVATAAGSYPVTVSNCGVAQTVTSNPSRAVTMNQGATEFMLAMGLENSMVGTAYLDDAIWPKYATAYAGIPVLSSGYPNETHLMAQNPDFIVASYNSAFRANYTDSRGRARGIFSPDTVGPCTGEGSDWDMSWTTCRPQLHAAGVGTYLFEDACENSSLRPSEVTEETVYEELRALGSVFNVNVTPLIEEMKADFDAAACTCVFHYEWSRAQDCVAGLRRLLQQRGSKSLWVLALVPQTCSCKRLPHELVCQRGGELGLCERE